MGALTSCTSPVETTSEHEFAESLYTPCAVIQDYLTRRIRQTSESPFAEKPIETPAFKYLNSEPVWASHNLKPPEGSDEAENARLLLLKYQDYISSRMDETLHEETISAYNEAQNEVYTFSDCEMSPDIRMKDSDRKIVEDRAAHNLSLYEQANEAVEEYRQKIKTSGEKYNAELASSIRSNILKDREAYVVLRISRVGINREFNQAILYSENYCGRLCGAGNYVVLELSDHRWRVVNITNVWVS